MSRLQELIAELCSDGVEYKELGDVCDYPRARVSSDDLGLGTYVSVENLAQDYRGLTGEIATTKPGTSVVSFEPGDVLVGNIRPYLKKVWLASFSGGTNGDVLVFRIRGTFKDTLLPEFLRAQLASDAFIDFDMKFAKGAKMPRGDKKAVLKYRIPVPPIEVQREVVRILDEYTAAHDELMALLSKELSTQGKARDEVNSFLFKTLLQDSSSRICSLGDVVRFINGRAYKQEELLESGKYRVLRVGNFFTSDSWYYSDLELPDDKYCFAGDLLYAWSASFGPKIWSGEKTIFHYHIWNLRFDERVLDKEYLYYYLAYDARMIRESNSVTRSTMMHVSMASMKKRPIVIPDLPTQRLVVCVLKRIENAYRDILRELNDEKRLRSQQLALVRSQLLTFPEKEG